jgi:hypothetical protein
MPNSSFTQQALANAPHFRQRVRAALATVAWQVLSEAGSVENHVIRANYARLVLANLDSVTGQILGWLVERPNLTAFTTSYDFTIGSVVTASGDPDIESQLATDWNVLAGV